MRSLFRSLQKEQQWAIHSFALYKKSNKEQFAFLLFTKRATKSNLLFCSLPKEQQRVNHSFKKSNKEQIGLSLFTKRVTKSKLLFRSLQKEQKSAKRVNCSFALFLLFYKKKSDALFFKKTDCPTLLRCSYPRVKNGTYHPLDNTSFKETAFCQTI